MHDRKALIRSIEEKTKCALLCVATSERSFVPAQLDESYVVNAHTLLRGLKLKDDQAVGLLIYSRGGQSQVPLELVAMIREMFPGRRLTAFVPYRAFSAATVIALGADEIVMGPRGHLGPIDATILGHPHSPRDENGQPLPVSAEEVRKYFELVREMATKEGSPALDEAAFQALASSVKPLALGAVQQTLKSTEHDAQVLLGARLEKKTEKENEKIVNGLASEITYHGHAIFRTEARSLGIDFVKNAEEYDIQEALWELVESYVNFFKAEELFEIRLQVDIDGAPEAKEDNVRFGLLETGTDARAQLVDYFCRKVRAPTPQFQLVADIKGAHDIVPRLADAIREALRGVEGAAEACSAEAIQSIVVGVLQQRVDSWLKVEGEKAVQDALDKTIPSGIMEWWRNRRWEKL